MFGERTFTATLVRSTGECPAAHSIAVHISGNSNGIVATEDAGEQHKLTAYQSGTECPSIAYWNDGVNVHQYNISASSKATDALFVISITGACQADYEMHAP